jgi:hypothetical protein
MKKTIVGYFDELTQAQRAIERLVENGFLRDDISLVASDPNEEYARKYRSTSAVDTGEISSTAAGATTGAVMGGIGGLLVGVGALAIPGIGPVIAAGPLATMLLGAGVGAAAGGLIGALIDVGIPEEEAKYYAEGLRRGGVVVTVSTEDEIRVNRAAQILESEGAVSIDRRVSEWRQSGWTGYDPTAAPYVPPTSGTEMRRSTDLNAYDTYVDDFRSNFNTIYGARGYTYDRYEPAYRYGYTLASDTRYTGKDWSAIEADVRRDWERNNQGVWEDFKDAIRYAWDRVRGRTSSRAA